LNYSQIIANSNITYPVLHGGVKECHSCPQQNPEKFILKFKFFRILPTGSWNTHIPALKDGVSETADQVCELFRLD